jgi:predicted HTH domain antitoxin
LLNRTWCLSDFGKTRTAKCVKYIHEAEAEELEMDALQPVRKTDLARNTRQILREVQRGRPAVVESHGQAEVAIIEIIDFYILRAVLGYYANSPGDIDEDALDAGALAMLPDDQSRYNLVLAHYLGGAISLSRAGELLDLPWLELRIRFTRLGIPLRAAPGTKEEAHDDVLAALNWVDEP